MSENGAVSGHAAGYGGAFNDYEGDGGGPNFPFIQISPAGFFYADVLNRDDAGTGAAWLAAAGAVERFEPQGRRDVLALDVLVFNHVARRRRFLVCDPRDGKQLAIRGDYDSAKAEADRRRAKVRGHVQLFGLATGPKGSKAADMPPFPVMLTAKGVQSTHLWGIERVIYERCVRPVERDGLKGIPPLAYSVQLGFGSAQKVGDFAFELHPVLVVAPASVLTAERAQSLIRHPVAVTRRAYDDSRPWVAAWTRFAAHDAEPTRSGYEGGERRDERRPPARGEDRREQPDDEIPF